MKKIESKKALPKYEAPRIITLNKEMILEELGPARANTSCADGFICGIPNWP